MKIEEIQLNNNLQTAKIMYDIIDKYHTDLKKIYDENLRKYSDYNIVEIFNFVKNIPYSMDRKFIELIARPKILLNFKKNGMDCKKKSILVGSWALCNRFKCRLIGSSTRLDRQIHHVYPEIFMNNSWIPMDTTYKENVLGGYKYESFRKPL